MNLVDAFVDGDTVTFGQFRIHVDAPPAAGRVILGIRPETFEDVAFAAAGLPSITAEVEVVEDLGSATYVFFHVEAPPITAEVLEARDDSLIASERALFTAQVDGRTAARVGGRLELALDPARFHYFAPDTGARIHPAPRQAAAVVG
jgi:ABC-type sugar transport system ATPase subunit